MTTPVPPRRRWRARLLRVLRGALFVYAVYAGALFALQRLLIFPAWLTPGTALEPLPPGGELWSLEPEPGVRVEAVFLAGRGASPAAPGPAVVFFHGNAERIDDWVAPLQGYVDRGASVLLVEYRGYGRSTGSPSRQALVADALAFQERLLRDPRVDPRRLALHGRSLGGGVACAVAAARPPAALVLQSTFARLSDQALRRGLPPQLLRDPFDSAAALAGLDLPVLIAHGRRDRVIPFAEGQELASQARRGRFLPLECDHNDCPPDWGAYLETVAGFLREAGVLARP